jgi:hypothetical protein
MASILERTGITLFRRNVMVAKITTGGNRNGGNKTGAAPIDVNPVIRDQVLAALKGQKDDPEVKFTVKQREEAFAAALQALNGVQEGESKVKSLQTQINMTKDGNGQRLFELAKRCVVLTMDGKKARLTEAADLMAMSCEFAEVQTLNAWVKTHPGQEAPKSIRTIVPSWPPLKGDTINAMRKGGIDPTTLVKPNDMRKAYKEWKEKNPEGVSNAGRAPQPGGRNPGGAEAAGTGGAKEHDAYMTNLGKMSEASRNAIRSLVALLAGLPVSVQNEAAERIDELRLDLASLSDDDHEAIEARSGEESNDDSEDAEAGIQTTTTTKAA